MRNQHEELQYKHGWLEFKTNTGSGEGTTAIVYIPTTQVPIYPCNCVSLTAVAQQHVPTWHLGKWNQRPRPAFPSLCSFEPHPNECLMAGSGIFFSRHSLRQSEFQSEPKRLQQRLPSCFADIRHIILKELGMVCHVCIVLRV